MATLLGISEFQIKGWIYKEFIKIKIFDRFICAAKLQKNKKCKDFEVRFCCPEASATDCSNELQNDINEKLELVNLTYDNLRNLNNFDCKICYKMFCLFN